MCYNVEAGGYNMYLRFWNCVACFIKIFIITIIILPLFFLIKINFDIGVAYCNYLNVSPDFCLTVMTPGLALGVAIILSFFEFISGCYLIDKLKQIKLIKVIYDKIYYM